MCGIAGFWDRRCRQPEGELRQTVSDMAATLAHRGPDSSGTWTDADAGLALGHTRLAVIDLSPTGQQPMASAGGRYQLVYNGEVYNHQELRRELEHEGQAFRGHSDTEVLLAAIARWGLDATLPRLVGMFAFALWDRQERRLTLVRDRLGIKPLYYGWVEGAIVFASELKALRRYPGFRGEVDRDALALFLQHSYVPTPWSIYRNVWKLPAGCRLTLATTDDLAQLTPYWTLKAAVARADAEPFRGGVDQATDELDSLLTDAVERRMIADVPLGAFLSGGIDSSLVVAMMQKQSPRPIKTFTIGFEEPEYNEAGYAEAIARHLGTEQTTCYVSPQEARDVIPRLPEMYDEPLGDSSQIPTFLVSQIARREVTVSLSGDGGDELFGGYQRYLHIDGLWRRINRIPRPLRGLAAPILSAGSRMLPARLAETVARRANRLSIATPGEMYCRHNIHWPEPHTLVRGARTVATIGLQPELWPATRPHLEQWMYADTLGYLPDDILVKVDRASMAVGLEARVPLLDHRVVEFAWRLPLAWKIRDGHGKWILRRLLERYLPTPLFDRPKTGFGVPIDRWLRGPLRDWAETLLAERRLANQGFLDPAPIRRKWAEHLSGRVDWHYHLWDVLMFQAWLDEGRR